MTIAMRNKAAVPCITCGETVEIDEGYFVKIKGKGWKVRHGICPVVNRARDALNDGALGALAKSMVEAARRSIK